MRLIITKPPSKTVCSELLTNKLICPAVCGMHGRKQAEILSRGPQEQADVVTMAPRTHIRLVRMGMRREDGKEKHFNNRAS